MVDPVLSEQAVLDAESNDIAKSGRRRNNRNKNRQLKNESTVTEISQTETRPSPAEREARKNLRRKPRAPRVREETENSTPKEKSDFTDGTLRLKISNSRPRTVYTRLVRLMLAGFDSAGNTLETQKPIEVVEVSALGNAIGPAIFVVDNLVKAKVAEQVSINADFVAVEGETVVSEGRNKGSPRLQITLKKSTSWNPKDDEVLQKTRVYRTKVLGLPEESRVAA